MKENSDLVNITSHGLLSEHHLCHMAKPTEAILINCVASKIQFLQELENILYTHCISRSGFTSTRCISGLAFGSCS